MGQTLNKLKYVVICLAIAFVMLSYYAYQIFFTANFANKIDDKPYTLYVRSGATFQDVLDTLDLHKVYEDKMSFAFISKILSYQDHVKPGRYIIPPSATNLQVVRKLRSGAQDPIKITFNNIRLKSEFIDRIGSKFSFGSDTLSRLLNNQKTCNKFGFDTTTILTMFLPNTYEFYWSISAEDFMDRMKEEYKAFWTQERKELASKAGLTPIQASILASIVDAETNQATEKSTVAGVYINRLNINMPLQADPTVKFALGDFAIKRINHELIDAAGNSPYNTYRVLGLPPGPINMPSITTIDNVLNYESHDYLFFVADPSKPGYHIFNTDYRSHVNQANTYRKSLNKRNIH
ncbi:endolytic transglycosylase MltG [uncultured Cytophaga sp.]|uniref:endolytic transglycosylase MltG n=1 Tax=uncultured Cytophaga sp. TaxID=160238 RepID=UPI00263965A3|nr:endolytic transglycosylase MltG [uncultured Cytophaga sp.]